MPMCAEPIKPTPLPYRYAASPEERKRLVGATAAVIRTTLVAKAMRILAAGEIEGRVLAGHLRIDPRAVDILLRDVPGIAKVIRRSERWDWHPPHRHRRLVAVYWLVPVPPTSA